MSAYRNVKADLINPVTKRDHTAVAILSTLAAGQRVLARDVQAAIAADPRADIEYRGEAVKALRNMGYAVVIRQKRHDTWYMLAADPTEHEDQRRQVIAETYSRQVSICRALAGAVTGAPHDASLATSALHAQMTALALGTDSAMGKTIAEVMQELAPL